MKISDTVNSINAAFNIIVINDPPLFDVLPLQSTSHHVAEVLSIILPTYTDPEGGPVTISVSGTTVLPAFLMFTAATREISGKVPYSIVNGTVFEFDMALSDGFNIAVYTYTITILNDVPLFLEEDP